MKRARRRSNIAWTSVVWTMLGLAGAVAVLWYRLGTLVPGVSRGELNQVAASSSVEQLIKNPLGLPHKLLQFGSQHFETSPLAIRSASAIIGLLIVVCFYYVVRSWYTHRIALFASLIFVTSPWFLHSVRLGTDSAIYLLLFLTVGCVTWLQNSRGSIWSVAASAVLLMALLYTPGMIWFVVPALLWQINRIGQLLETHNSGLLTLLSLFVLVLLVPIGWAMFQDPHLIKTYFGLPQVFPGLEEIAKNLARIPSQLFWQGPKNPEIWLGRLPLLDWFTAVMFVVGVYAMLRRHKLDRTVFLVSVAVIGSALIAIRGPVEMILLQPFVFLVAAAGIALMLQRWFTVFPRNPFARTVGATLLTIVVLMTVVYNVNSYFIAWPNAPETKAVFRHKLN